MNPINDQQLDLDEIEARLNAASKGPWKLSYEYCDCSENCGHGLYVSRINTGCGPATELCELPRGEWELMVHARQDVEQLVAEVRRLRARVAELEARHLPKLCECGHTRLVHTVPAPHSCFAGKIKGAKPCDCGEYRQLSFAEAERRIAERHAAQAEQRAAAEETHVVADDSDDPEHIDDCPGCEPATEDTLPEWLYHRFSRSRPNTPAWDALVDEDRAYWAHQAAAVRRAVARGGFKAARPAVRPAVETGA